VLTAALAMRVLVVDDDEEEFVLAGDLLETEAPGQYAIQWTPSYEEALETLQQPAVNVALIDYQLGIRSGLDLIGALVASPSKVPLILLTGQGDRDVDSAALAAGATDYLDKRNLTGPILDRSLRYAIGRRRAADAVRRSHDRFRALFDNSPSAIYIANLTTGLVEDVNGQFEELTGYRREHIVGHSTLGLGLWVEADVRDALSLRAAAGQSVRNADLQMICRSGERRHVLVSLEHLSNGANREPSLVSVILDVTEQRALETQLRQAQKMEAVGQLAGGVAHDFNNLLTAILGYTALVLDDLPADSPACNDLREIQLAGERAAALTAQLLAFSRRSVLEPRVIDLNVLVRKTHSLLKRLLGEDVMLTSNLAPELRAVFADAGQIDQMIVNLAVNARDAMPSGGHLAIDTANVMLDQAFVADHPGATVGPHVMIAVTDTGTGMDEVVKARLFEPFYTTKGPSKGTGLGLAMVFGIVKQTGGSIWVDSQQGVGSTFTVYLPATDQPLFHEDSPQPATASTGSETILVVEDQDEVRRLVREVLGRSGYTVMVASDPDEALSVLANASAPIHLLLTDVVMPKMSGRELSRICYARYPELRVLYMSGYPSGAVGQDGLLEPGLALIQKPFAGPVLLQRVRAVLDSPSLPGV
jgi:PAS domain S-box-containing protein